MLLLQARDFLRLVIFHYAIAYFFAAFGAPVDDHKSFRTPMIKAYWLHKASTWAFSISWRFQINMQRVQTGETVIALARLRRRIQNTAA